MRKKSHDMCEFCEGIVEERIIQVRFHFKGQTIYVDRAFPDNLYPLVYQGAAELDHALSTRWLIDQNTSELGQT